MRKLITQRHVDDGGPGLAMLILALVAVALLNGCGGSALQRQAAAASATRVLLDASASGIEAACSEDRVTDDGDRLTACIRAIEAHEAGAAAWIVWADALLTATYYDEDDDALDVALTLALPVLRAYREIAEAMRALGVPLPELPESVSGLVGS